MRQETIQWVEKEKVIAIVRGVAPDDCLNVAEALYQGGIRLLEITFNQSKPESFEQTAAAIRAVAETYRGKMLVGAGTVITKEQLTMAAEAGAKYIISPDVDTEIIRETVALGMVSMPGAMSPSEVKTAHNAGADFVKIFPAGTLGSSYVKALRAPMSHVKLLAVGGVNEENAADFIKAGCCGVGVGGNLANKKWIEAGELNKVTEAAQKLMEKVKGGKKA